MSIQLADHTDVWGACKVPDECYSSGKAQRRLCEFPKADGGIGSLGQSQGEQQPLGVQFNVEFPGEQAGRATAARSLRSSNMVPGRMPVAQNQLIFSLGFM
jgi:hypothetical protein